LCSRTLTDFASHGGANRDLSFASEYGFSKGKLLFDAKVGAS
jgi:hypothetical protein